MSNLYYLYVNTEPNHRQCFGEEEIDALLRAVKAYDRSERLPECWEMLLDKLEVLTGEKLR